jgi:hypothetical protein
VFWQASFETHFSFHGTEGEWNIFNEAGLLCIIKIVQKKKSGLDDHGGASFRNHVAGKNYKVALYIIRRKEPKI